MLDVKCNRCDKELDKPGGILFGPPVDGNCNKLHLCENCYYEVELFIIDPWSYTWATED